MDFEEDTHHFDAAAERMIELGNQLLDQDADSDSWEVASGLLAGAVQFWLYAHQPCGDLGCESCGEIDTAEIFSFHESMSLLLRIAVTPFAGAGMSGKSNLL